MNYNTHKHIVTIPTEGKDTNETFKTPLESVKALETTKNEKNTKMSAQDKKNTFFWRFIACAPVGQTHFTIYVGHCLSHMTITTYIMINVFSLGKQVHPVVPDYQIHQLIINQMFWTGCQRALIQLVTEKKINRIYTI